MLNQGNEPLLPPIEIINLIPDYFKWEIKSLLPSLAKGDYPPFINGDIGGF
jgi:hypothetical protein